MTVELHRLKEHIERRLGRRLHHTDGFPWLASRRRFLTVRMDLNNKCNLRCRMCYMSLDEVWKQPLVEMDQKLLGQIEREVWPLTEMLYLSCAGEPLIAKNIAEALKRAQGAGVPFIQMITNGLALNDENARMILRNGLNRLNISIDGATDKTYNAIRTGSNFERVIDNINNLISRREEEGSDLELHILAVMMLENLQEWPDIVSLAADLGAREVGLIAQTYYTELKNEDGLWNHREDVNRMLLKARDMAQQRGINLVAPEEFDDGQRPEKAQQRTSPPFCNCPWDEVVLYPDGQVLPCARMFGEAFFGNLKKQAFADIFWGDPWRALRESTRRGDLHPVCRKCPASQSRDLNSPAAFEKRNIHGEISHEETR